eukprot:9481850-Pyramimonas_sp.AAC.3
MTSGCLNSQAARRFNVLGDIMATVAERLGVTVEQLQVRVEKCGTLEEKHPTECASTTTSNTESLLGRESGMRPQTSQPNHPAGALWAHQSYTGTTLLAPCDHDTQKNTDSAFSSPPDEIWHYKTRFPESTRPQCESHQSIAKEQATTA